MALSRHDLSSGTGELPDASGRLHQERLDEALDDDEGWAAHLVLLGRAPVAGPARPGPRRVDQVHRPTLVTRARAGSRGGGRPALGAEGGGNGCASDGALGVHRGGLRRLELGHRTNDPASCRVARAAGSSPEGVEREELLDDGERFDVERHARLATDPWPPSP